jgi:hypothetical protein
MDESPQKRGENGTVRVMPRGVRFGEGQPTNAGGRPKKLGKRLRELFPDDELIAAFARTARGEPFPNGVKPSSRDMMDALRWIAEYGHGKAPTYAVIQDEDPLGQLDDVTKETARILEELRAGDKERAA